MSRVGIYAGKKVTFTHRNPQTGEYWTDDLRKAPKGPFGMWIDSKQINFDLEPKESKFRKSGRRSRA